jgi:glycosyltransferase involved in cell wall biosynthesis
MTSIYFVGPYKPIICGIADYTGFLTKVCPAERWGMISFNPEKYGTPLVENGRVSKSQVWYGMRDRQSYNASVIMNGLSSLGGIKENSTLWFQHEFGIWPNKLQFIEMLKDIRIPKVITFHTIHFQSEETPYGLRTEQYDFLGSLLPLVDAITVFSKGAYQAVTSAFPEHQGKVHVLRHGVHSYPEVSRLNRREAREKLLDYLLYESNLDLETKYTLHKQRIFIDKNTVVIGQTGFLSPNKGTEQLYRVRNLLQKSLPDKRIIAVRVGAAVHESQEIYADELQQSLNGKTDYLLKGRLPESILPLAQRAFDVNFYWPLECTQSGVISHALGTGAIIAGRDLEGVGETLKNAGELCDSDINRLILKMENLIIKPGLAEKIEDSALAYARKLSWENQINRHFEVTTRITARSPVSSALKKVDSGDNMLPMARGYRTEYAGLVFNKG